MEGKLKAKPYAILFLRFTPCPSLLILPESLADNNAKKTRGVGVGKLRIWLLVKSRFGMLARFGASIFERCGKSILLTLGGESL